MTTRRGKHVTLFTASAVLVLACIVSWLHRREIRSLYRFWRNFEGMGKIPNRFGLYDLHGNVEEWCEDVYDPEFFSRPRASGPDPLATGDSRLRVCRGGSFLCDSVSCRAASRNGLTPFYRLYTIGFRPVAPPRSKL